MSQDWLFAKSVRRFLHKQLCLPSILTFWPWLAVTLPGSVKCRAVLRGEGGIIRHHPQLLALPVFCWVPTDNNALIGGTETLPAGTRWGGCIHLQFWDEKAQQCVLLRLRSLFSHIICTLTNTTHWLALVTGLKGSNTVYILYVFAGPGGLSQYFSFPLPQKMKVYVPSAIWDLYCAFCRSSHQCTV